MAHLNDSTTDSKTSVSGASKNALIETIKADMSYNERPLLLTPKGRGWEKGSVIGMGIAPRGDATPPWWAPNDLNLKTSNYWSTITPWFVIFAGSKHKASNVRIKVSNIKLFILKNSTHEWIMLKTENGSPKWANEYDYGLGPIIGKANPRIEEDGLLSYKLSSDFHPIHGGVKKVDFNAIGINSSDIAAIIATLQSELILDDPNQLDDSSQSELLIQVGADYYPNINSVLDDFYPMVSVPCVGGSRFGLVTKTKRSHYFSTVNIALSIAPSAFVENGGTTTAPVEILNSLPAEL